MVLELCARIIATYFLLHEPFPIHIPFTGNLIMTPLNGQLEYAKES